MAFPLIGALLASGLLGGAGAAASGGGLFGKKGKFEQIGLQTPQQQEAFSQLLGGLAGPQASGLQFLGDMLSGDPEAMAKFQRPTIRQFEQQVVPKLAERFAGLGTGGSLSSSAFNQTMGQAGRELSENLSAQRGQLQMQAMQQLAPLLGLSQQRTFENVYRQPQAGFFGAALGGMGSGLGQYAVLSQLGNLGNNKSGLGGTGQGGTS